MAVQEANRRVHRPTAERKARREAEDMGGSDAIECPSHVKGKASRELFMRTAGMLRDMGIWREADSDQLARYVMAEMLYRITTAKYANAIQHGDEGLASTYERRQDKAFRQAQAAANTLGLNVTSRCRVAVPQRVHHVEKLEL